MGQIMLNGVTLGAFRSCAISYWVGVGHLGHGHATRAVGLALSYAFDELGLHRVQAETLPDNVASQKVPRSARFSLFGSAPGYLRINDAWRDHVLFQRLNEEQA